MYPSFGKLVIQSVIGDRKSVGKDQFVFLNRNKIRYYIRNYTNSKVLLSYKNEEIKISYLFNRFKTNQFVYDNKIVRIKGGPCYLSGCKFSSSNLQQKFLIILSFNKPENA